MRSVSLQVILRNITFRPSFDGNSSTPLCTYDVRKLFGVCTPFPCLHFRTELPIKNPCKLPHIICYWIDPLPLSGDIVNTSPHRPCQKRNSPYAPPQNTSDMTLQMSMQSKGASSVHSGGGRCHSPVKTKMSYDVEDTHVQTHARLSVWPRRDGGRDCFV